MDFHFLMTKKPFQFQTEWTEIQVTPAKVQILLNEYFRKSILVFLRNRRDHLRLNHEEYRIPYSSFTVFFQNNKPGFFFGHNAT